MQTHRDRGEPGGWGQQPAPSWTRGKGAGRGFALVLLPWVQPKELSPERPSHGWGGSAQDFVAEQAACRERRPSAVGEKLCRVSMPSIEVFAQRLGLGG